MKKTKLTKKLTLPTETIRVLDHRDLVEVAGGGATKRTCDCPTCGNPQSTCPV